MSQATRTTQVNVAGKTFTQQRTTTADGTTLKDPTLAAAKAGALTTRTSATVGVLTMDTGHGIPTGRLDLYWDGGARYGVAGVTTVDSIAISGGAGNDLPADESAITAMVPQLEDFAVESADLASLSVGSIANLGAWAVFIDDADAVVKAIKVDSSTDAWLWDSTDTTDVEATNPFNLGDVVSVYLSHGDSSASREVAAVAQVN